MSQPVGTPAQSQQRLAQQRQRARSIAIGVSLALLVAMFYAATIVRMGGSGALHWTADASRGDTVAK